MKSFIMQNWTSILAVAIFIIAIVVLWILGKKDIVKRVLFTLVCRAEKEFGSGTGILKLDAVVSAFYLQMPLIVRLFFPKALIIQYIEKAVLKMKAMLSSGITLDGYEAPKIEEKPPDRAEISD